MNIKDVIVCRTSDAVGGYFLQRFYEFACCEGTCFDQTMNLALEATEAKFQAAPDEVFERFYHYRTLNPFLLFRLEREKPVPILASFGEPHLLDRDPILQASR